MNKLLEYYFWFNQPSTILELADRNFGIGFGVLAVLGLIFLILIKFLKSPVNRKLLRKFWRLAFSTGLSGLVWLGIRYENTYIFGRRYWAGLVILTGIVWLIFILKYLVFNFPKEKREYQKESIKNKYLPKAK